MICFYYWPTGNGLKVAILLEELGQDYRVQPINIRAGDQRQDSFQQISANGRIPAIVKARPAVQRAYAKGREVAVNEKSLALQ